MTPFHFTAPGKPSEDERVVSIPAGISSKKELFEFLFRAIPLPNYFGHNWDALEECLGDLNWLDGKKIVLVHKDIPMSAAPADQKIYIQILAKAAHNPKLLNVIFPEDVRAPIEKLLAKTG